MTKFVFFITFLVVSNITYSACRNYHLIARQADFVSQDLRYLKIETRRFFPNSINLYEFIQRAELDASFLHRVTRSGAMPCWQTQSNYYNLNRSVEILRNYFRNFSSRRDIREIEYEWRRFIDSFFRLEMYIQNAREE